MREYMEVICNIGRDKGAQMRVHKATGESGILSGTFLPVEVKTPVAEVEELPKPSVTASAKVPVKKGVKSKTMTKSAKGKKR